MVVDPVEYFDVGVIGQPPVGEVGLPAFVGLFGGKADIGGFGTFLWLRVDVAAGAQMAVNGVDRHGDAVVVL